MKRLALPLFALSLLLPFTTHAHDTWILPSATILSGDAAWITVDAAVGNEKFYFNHRPLPLTSLQIISPSNKHLEPENPFTGELRSGFDVHLTEAGTYRIAMVRNGVSAQWKEDGKAKRWFGAAGEYAKTVPQNATELKVQERNSRIETFVTKGKPSAISQIKEGIGLTSVTHFNDLFAGEPTQFIVTIDGLPAKQTPVEIEPEGSRYRDSINAIHLKTDDEGKFEVTWPQAGRYWLGMQATTQTTTVPNANARLLSYSATLEIMPQ